MTIGQFMNVLKVLDKNTIITNVKLSDYGSDRGDYYDFYLGESENESTKVGDILDLLTEKVVGKTFYGYKGGEFTMTEETEIRLGAYGSSGYSINGILFKCDYDNIVSAQIKVGKVLYY